MLFNPKRSNIITIVGCGTSVYQRIHNVCAEVPLEDEQVWTLNTGGMVFRHDVLWDMHTDKWIAKCIKRDPDYERLNRRREWMKTHDKLIVMPNANPLFPTSRTFPLKQVIEETKSNYFSTGVAYMLAMAYVLKPLTLRLFGLDFTYKREEASHPDEIPGAMCCAYWVGRIKEAGIKIEVPNQTLFLDMRKRAEGYLYGYHEPATWEFDEEGIGTFTSPDYAADQS